MPHFYHYYQLRVQSIWDWQLASILHVLSPSPIRIISPLSDAHKVSWILCFAEGLSCTSSYPAWCFKHGLPYVLSTEGAWQGLQLWGSVLMQVTILSLRGNVVWVWIQSPAMMPLLAAVWYFPEAQPLSLWYAEQFIVPTVRKGLVSSVGTPGWSIHLCFLKPEVIKKQKNKNVKGERERENVGVMSLEKWSRDVSCS